MTDCELLELILEKISTLEVNVSKIQVGVEELVSENYGYAQTEKAHEAD
ncbi:MAG: hypothetical protein H6Q73_4501 [Firmicutes bacterium]|nr:hypothetical protein [Bacillota bacterium]